MAYSTIILILEALSVLRGVHAALCRSSGTPFAQVSQRADVARANGCLREALQKLGASEPLAPRSE